MNPASRRVLQFRRHYRVETLEPDNIILLSEFESRTLTGQLYYHLAPLLDGTHTRDEIIASLNGQFPAIRVQYALGRLEQMGYLVETDPSYLWEKSAYQDLLFAPETPVKKKQVVLYTIGQMNIVGLSDTLKSLDIKISQDDSEASLAIVFVRDYLQPALKTLNQRFHASGLPWLLMKPTGAILWIGPIFEGDQTACWQCLAQRLENQRSIEAFLQQKKGLSEPIFVPETTLPVTQQMGFHLAALEADHWLTLGRNLSLENRLITFDTITLQTQEHMLVKRPQCPVCGNPATPEPRPIMLQSRKKIITFDGGHRSMETRQVFNRYKHHISPITGAVNMLQRVDSPEFIHIYAAGHNKSRSFQKWQNLRKNLRSQNAGKGMTEIQAKVSGLCEALERYSTLQEGTEPRQRAYYRDIQDDAIHPDTFLLYSESQYQNRDAWNKDCPPHLTVPQPFDEHKEIEWSPVWSLTEQRFKYMPTACCYYDYMLPDDHYFCDADSNGTAAGSSLEDAILQGFFELVERDSIALWWYNRLKRPGIDLDKVHNSYVQQARAFYQSVNREIVVLDITSNLGIPVCVALSRRINQGTENIIMGFGAHFDPTIALIRAITELNQSLPAVLINDIRNTYYSQSPWEIRWWKNATFGNQPYLVPDDFIPITTYSSLAGANFRDDIMKCQAIVEQQGLEMLVLDNTRPDIGLPVVRVFVPGLRHFWSRFAPGRLYDVPVKMGWLDAPTPEDDLNNEPMFL